MPVSSSISPLGNLLGIGGSSAGTDRGFTLEGFGDLRNLMYHLKQMGYDTDSLGLDESKQAFGDLQAPRDYYSKLLSGDRSATMQAVAPTVTAANAQEDAQKRELAGSGTARGGGVNATTQQLDTSKASTIDNAISALKPQAAQGATQVASTEGQMGSSILQHAMSLLGLGESAGVNLSSLASNSRATSYSIGQDQASQGGQGVGMLLTALGYL